MILKTMVGMIIVWGSTGATLINIIFRGKESFII